MVIHGEICATFLFSQEFRVQLLFFIIILFLTQPPHMPHITQETKQGASDSFRVRETVVLNTSTLTAYNEHIQYSAPVTVWPPVRHTLG